MRKFTHTAIALLAVLLNATVATAQAPQTAEQEKKPDVPAAFTRSLLFSPIEVTMLERAIAGTVTGEKMLEVGKTAVDIPQRRTIVLSGIVFRSQQDWTIWLNGHKVTPEKLLPEIVDIHVENGKVDLRWFDIGINGIISLTLRPHQTYDVVTGVLLPG